MPLPESFRQGRERREENRRKQNSGAVKKQLQKLRGIQKKAPLPEQVRQPTGGRFRRRRKERRGRTGRENPPEKEESERFCKGTHPAWQQGAHLCAIWDVSHSLPEYEVGERVGDLRRRGRRRVRPGTAGRCKRGRASSSCPAGSPAHRRTGASPAWQ